MMRVLAVMLWAGPALAGPLDGAGVTAALTGQKVVYQDGSSQTFRADGVTFYTAPGGAESQGRWRVEGNRYCSVWPPSDSWACYDVEGEAEVIRFISGGGDVTAGRLDQPISAGSNG